MMNWDKYGIKIPYGRTSGNVKVHCPQCRDQRHDKRDKSLSCDLATGMFKCHYCGFSGCAKEPDEQEDGTAALVQRSSHTETKTCV